MVFIMFGVRIVLQSCPVFFEANTGPTTYLFTSKLTQFLMHMAALWRKKRKMCEYIKPVTERSGEASFSLIVDSRFITHGTWKAAKKMVAQDKRSVKQTDLCRQTTPQQTMIRQTARPANPIPIIIATITVFNINKKI
jgi:hypothetical protein